MIRLGIRDWNFKVKQAQDGTWLAWAARVDDLGDGPLDMKALPPTIEVHYEFGANAEAALQNLKRSIAEKICSGSKT
jgi:hypothetical protein